MPRSLFSFCLCPLALILILLHTPITALSLSSSNNNLRTLPLSNLTVRCCVLTGFPYVIPNFPPASIPQPLTLANYSGLAIDFFTALLHRTGLTCHPVRQFNHHPNKLAWNDFIYNLGNCTTNGIVRNSTECQCDIGIGAWFETSDRIAVSFLPPFILDDVHVAVHIDEVRGDSNSAFFFFTAFDTDVWAAIALLIVIFAILKLFDTRFASRISTYSPLPRSVSVAKRFRHYLIKSDRPYRVRRAFQSTMSNLLGFCFLRIEGEHRSTRQWILNYIIMLCGLFLVLTYEATMTATLVQETSQSRYRSLRDFQTCHIPDNQVCFVRGDFMEKEWDNVISKAQCRLLATEVQPGPQRYSNLDDLIEATVNGTCSFMVAGGAEIGLPVHKRYCGTIVMSGKPFLTRGLSMVVPLNWPYYNLLTKETLKLIEDRQNLTTISEYYEREGACERSTTIQLSFDKLRLYFLTAFITVGLLLAEMIIDPQQPLSEEEEDQSGSDSGLGE